MIRSILVFFVGAVLSASCALAQTDWSQDLETDIKVNVNLVVVDAQVLNKKTHAPVSSLSAEDFRLFENGAMQQISSLSQDKLPLSVVFLFDLTDSVRPVLENLGKGAMQALQHLKPEDKAAVMAYSSTVQLLQDFTTDRDLAVKAIRKASRMESREAAFFNEALFQAGARLGNVAATDRRVIIWLTDNVPNLPSEEIRNQYGRSIPEGNLHTEAQAMRELFKTGAVIFTLLQRSDISDFEFAKNFHDPMYQLYRRQYPPGDVFKYTQQTGGEVVESYSSRKIAIKMADLIDQIRTRYALGYHPTNKDEEDKFREIRLEISPDVVQREGKMIVETKKGYYR